MHVPARTAPRIYLEKGFDGRPYLNLLLIHLLGHLTGVPEYLDRSVLFSTQDLIQVLTFDFLTSGLSECVHIF